MRKKIIFIIGIILAGSCNRVANVEEEIELLKSKPIDLCIDYMKYTLNENANWTEEDSISICRPSAGLVVFFDSTICAACATKAMYKWYDIMDETHKMGDNDFKFYFVFSAPSNQTEDIKYNLRNISFEYPIFLDTCNVFAKRNTHIPSNPLLHVFMLDEKQNVVMVGSPLGNERLRKIYFQQLRKFNRHI